MVSFVHCNNYRGSGKNECITIKTIIHSVHSDVQTVGVIRTMLEPNKLTPREFAKDRRILEKSILSSLQVELKPKKWSKKSNFFFKVDNRYFWSLTLSVHENSELISVVLAVKPMSIDPILWEIFCLPENNNAPKSLRANGAYVCSSFPINNIAFELTSGDIEKGLDQIKLWLDNSFERGKQRLEKSLFSDLLLEHENQKERGAYAISLVCSLINEKSKLKALEVAKSYENGELKSCFDMVNIDKNSFHYHAIRWLERNDV